jgi:hypothetical protein
MIRSAIASLLLFLGGCYGYYPAVTPTPVGRDVQVTLSDSGTFTLARQVGPQTAAIDGRLTLDSGNALVLSVTNVRRRDGSEVDWKGERVTVPRPVVIKVEERRFSRGRTTLFAGALAIGLLGTRQALGGSGFSFLGSGQSKQGSAK